MAKKPKMTRREVEFHQSVARGKAAQEASQRGCDPKVFAAVSQGERGVPTVLSAAVKLRPLTLQVQLCLTEYALLLGALPAAGLTPPAPEKKLLHYVAMFADPALAFEHLTDYEAPVAARWRDLGGLAFGYAEVLGEAGAVEKATTHIARELNLLDAFNEPEAPPGKPARAAATPRPRRGAATERAG